MDDIDDTDGINGTNELFDKTDKVDKGVTMGKEEVKKKAFRVLIRCSLEEMDILPSPVSSTVQGMIKFLYAIVPAEEKENKAQLFYFGALFQKYAKAKDKREEEYYLSQISSLLAKFLKAKLENSANKSIYDNSVTNATNGLNGKNVTMDIYDTRGTFGKNGINATNGKNANNVINVTDGKNVMNVKNDTNDKSDTNGIIANSDKSGIDVKLPDDLIIE